MVLKCLKRELDKFPKKIEQYANGEISEQAMDEYMRECPFDLMYGHPPDSPCSLCFLFPLFPLSLKSC